MSERVDRDALIEAAGFAVARYRSAPYGPQTEDYECADPASAHYLRRAAGLVRSLGDEQ